MATRQSASPVLAEGQTVSVLQRPATRRVTRTLNAVGLPHVQEYQVQSGALVPTVCRANTTPKPVVGSLITIENARANRVPTTTDAMHNWAGSGWRQLVVSNGSTLFIVRDISPDGKFLKVNQLYRSVGRNASLSTLCEGHTGLVRWGVRYCGAQTDDLATVSRYMNIEPLGNTVASDLNNCSYTRVSHVSKVWDIEDVSPLVWQAYKNRMMEAVRDNLYARLNAQDARCLRAYSHPTNNEQRRQLGEYVGHVMREAVKYAKGGHEALLGEALRMLRARVDNDRHLYSVSVSTFMDRAVARISALSAKEIHYAEECGHYHMGETVELWGRYGMFNVCPTCGARSVEVLNATGDTVRVLDSAATYEWADGTTRCVREPSVIGGRHSGKGIVGFLPSIEGVARDKMLTIGVELEMQSVNTSQRELLARQMRNRLVEANLLDSDKARKYAHFEEDGSTGPGGFELVTGYTDLATHAKYFKTMLTNEDGSSPWRNKLRSHDAVGGTCGIHVHIQKPASLVHASKMRYFINASSSRALIEDVARRYNANYARIDPHPGEPTTSACTAVRRVKYGGKTTKQHVRLALGRINNDSRYEALNFQNDKTVEFRVFRGTLLYESLMACLEFTKAVWLFTRDTAATSLKPAEFTAWINRAEHRKDTRNLRSYLKRRGWDTVVPNANKAVQTAAVQQPETGAVDDAVEALPL